MSDATAIHVPLTRGQIAIISAEDADLAEAAWVAGKVYRSEGYYAMYWDRSRPIATMSLMHRIILSRMIGRSLNPHEECDHIDLDKLNNQRCNLRVATHAQNQQNSRKYKNNTSGYKGVDWYAPYGKWRARIRVNGKRFHLGCFDTPLDAYNAYCEAAIKYHGEFAHLE